MKSEEKTPAAVGNAIKANGPAFTAAAAAGLLTVIGLVMIYSASALPGSLEGGRGEFHFLTKQFVFLLASLAVLIAVTNLPFRWIESLGYAALGLTAISLALVLVPSIGYEVNGARRWFRYGTFGFQASDFAKIALILFMAHHLGRNRRWASSFFRGALPVMIATALLAGLVVIEPDFGTALFLLALGGVLAVAGGIRWIHLAPPFVAGVPAMAFLMWQKFDHVKDRIAVFLDPTLDPLGKGHQVRQSLIALGSGGVLGRSLGAGRQKLFFLPEDFTDFILALVGEEMGLMGTMIVVLCLLAFFIAALAIAKRAKTKSGYLIALGVGIMVSLQGFINIAVVTASVPTKGISLPFVSYGGSSLVAMMLALGLLMNVARDSKKPMPAEEPAAEAPVPVPA